MSSSVPPSPGWAGIDRAMTMNEKEDLQTDSQHEPPTRDAQFWLLFLALGIALFVSALDSVRLVPLPHVDRLANRTLILSYQYSSSYQPHFRLLFTILTGTSSSG